MELRGRLTLHHARQLNKAALLNEDEVNILAKFSVGGVKAPSIKTNWAITEWIDGKKMLVVSMDKTEERSILFQVLKRLGIEHAYQPAGSGKLWRIDADYAFVVEDILDELHHLSPDVRDYVKESSLKATDEQKIYAHRGPVFKLSADGAHIFFTYEYEPHLASEAKANKSAYCKKVRPGKMCSTLQKQTKKVLALPTSFLIE